MVKYATIVLLSLILLAGCNEPLDDIQDEEILPFSTVDPEENQQEDENFFGNGGVQIEKYNLPPQQGTLLEEDLLKRVNNETPASELITTFYPQNELLKFNYYTICMVNVDLDCKIECLRKIDDNKYYSIHKADSGGTLYLLYERNEDGYLWTEKTWYFHEELKKEDFGALLLKKSYDGDVKKLDPYSRYIMGYTGVVNTQLISNHQTVDGYSITIVYTENIEPDSERPVLGRRYIVKDVVAEKRADSIYAQLLPMDRPDQPQN